MQDTNLILGAHGNYGSDISYLQKYRAQKNVNHLILLEQSKSSISKGTFRLLTKDKNGPMT